MSFANPSVSLQDRLKELVGRSLTSVAFHAGTIVLAFDGHEVACYVPPRVNRDGWSRKGDAGWASALVAFVDAEVRGLRAGENQVLLDLDDGQIEIPIRVDGTREAGVLRRDNGEYWVMR